MNILYISQRLPYPPNRGDRIPTFNHIKYLSQRHKVFAAALYQDREDEKHIAKLSDWATAVVAEYQPRRMSMRGALRALSRGLPISPGYFFNRKLGSRIQALIADGKIEAVVVFSSSMAQYVEGNANLVRIMNFCDVDSQKWSDLAARARGFKAWIFRREARLLLELERKIAASFTASCVVTENEAAIFRRFIPGAEPVVVANGVDSGFFGATVRKPVAQELAFVGVMDYEPNVEAVVFFAREVWPNLRALFPAARFNIVGARPSREVQNLAAVPGITVTGFVEDVRSYLATAALIVIPLAVARGIQNKILEAMAAGVPVLTAPAAAAGFSPEARARLFTAAREAEPFLEAIRLLLSDADALRLRGESAQAFVREHFSWESKTKVLENLIVNAVSKPAGA